MPPEAGSPTVTAASYSNLYSSDGVTINGEGTMTNPSYWGHPTLRHLKPGTPGSSLMLLKTFLGTSLADLDSQRQTVGSTERVNQQHK